MRRAKRARGQSSVSIKHRSATGLVACLALWCGSISAFNAPGQLCSSSGNHQPPCSSHRGIPPSFSKSGSGACTHSELLWTLNKLFLSPQQQQQQQSSTSAADSNIKSAMLSAPQLDITAPSRQQQAVLDLPQSPKERQKSFSALVVDFVKAGDGEGALELYGRAAEVGCMISENVFNAVLSVCEGDKAPQGRVVLSDMMAAGIKPRENHYAFLLREAAGRGAFEDAFVQVREMVEGGMKPRLRTYAPLLQGLCNKPDMALAVEVWEHMTAHGVQPTPREHVDMIKGWAAAGELRQRVADGSVEAFLDRLGGMAFELEVEFGPGVEDAAAAAAAAELSRSELSGAEGEPDIDLDDIASARAGLLHALMGAFNCDSNLSSSSGDVQTYSSSTGPIASLSSATAAAPEGEDARGMEGSVCSCCGAPLRVVGLDSPARARVRSALRRLGAETASTLPPLPPPRRRQSSRLDSAYAGEGPGEGEQGGERGLGEEAMGDLAQFAAWLEERRREGVHYTTVVDGCNVAYYGQNKEGGKFQISQVDLLARRLEEEEGERVLIVLPERYLRPCVPNSARTKRGKNPPSALSDEELETIEGWRQRQMVYSCANGADDDLFWMYFTVSSDEGGGGGEGIGRDSDSVGERGAARLTVVSNDEMRNHRMALLEPVPFKRWRNSQVRGFHFPASVPPEGNPGISLSVNGGAGDERPERDRLSRPPPPPPALGSPQPPVVCRSPTFTRDMQVLDHAWHIPVRARKGGEPAWLCINLGPLVEREDGVGQAGGIRPSEVQPRRKYRS